MAEPITVREVRPNEYEALGVLTLAAYRAVLGPDMDAGYVAELADVAGRAGRAEVLVAVDPADRLLGTITYVPGPGRLAWFDGQDEAGLRMLAVAPPVQARGVGARLVAASVERATAAGKTRLFLHTTATMTVAHRLYERVGFRRDPGRDEVLPGGLVLLAYVLELER
jgi:GNAT superfamily N-acetyltransferase